MQKMTLLEMVQNILSAMNSDEVNSIGDTVESLQVAEEIRTTFFELFSNRDLPEFQGLIALESSGDATMPHALKIPDTVERIKWVKYLDERNGVYNTLTYLEPEDFINRMIQDQIDPATPYELVKILPSSTVTYSIRANAAPSYYTVFANENILVCDSWDNDYESNLTANHTLAWGTILQEFDLTDDFVPPIDAHLFPHLLHEARSACFINIKEVANSKEEQRARRQLVRSQNKIHRAMDQKQGVFSGIDYSRKR